jgi:hypothetical protein
VRLRPRSSAWLAAALPILLVACSSGETASPTPRPTLTPIPSASAGATGAPRELPDLEALLPDEVGGEATQKLSMSGATLLGSGGGDPTFTDFLERLGAEAADVGVAYAFTAEGTVQAFAYRVDGAATEMLVDELQASVETAQEAEVAWEEATVGDKSVRRGTAAGATDAAIYVYGHADTAFIIVTEDPELAAEVATALP